MNETELISKLEEKLKELFSKTRGVELIEERRERVISNKQIDLDLMLRTNGNSFRVIVEIKSSGTPRVLREAAAQLRSFRKAIGDSAKIYLMIGAPFVSDIGMDLCKEEGVGCFDLVGNCYISFGSVYVEIRGNKNVLPSTRSVKSLFSPKSSRITRVLLSNAKKLWKIQELAKEANVSLGLVSNIKTRLLEEEFLVEEGKSVRVKSPKLLLDTWADNYRYRKNEIKEFYSLDNATTTEQRIIQFCKMKKIHYGLGLFSGASRVAPFVRFNKSFVFVDAILEEVASESDLKPVVTGANVALLRPYDEGVFYGTQEIDGFNVVSKIQLYIDLKTYKGRGEEAAEFLYRTKIELEWRQG